MFGKSAKDGKGSDFPVAKTPEDWKRELSPEQFYVLREHGTERAGTSPLNQEKRSGVFKCAGCGNDLFESGTKFESGTGWPSFFQPDGRRNRDVRGPQLLHDANRSALRPLRRASRTRIPRRPQAHRPALLHERRGDEVRPESLKQALHES